MWLSASALINCERKRQNKRIKYRSCLLKLSYRNCGGSHDTSSIFVAGFECQPVNGSQTALEFQSHCDWDLICSDNWINVSFGHSSLTYERYFLTPLACRQMSNWHRWMVLHHQCIAASIFAVPLFKTSREFIVVLSNQLTDTLAQLVNHVQMCLCASIDMLLCICHAQKWNRFSCQHVNEMVSVTHSVVYIRI